MATKAVFTMKLDPELRDAFMAATDAEDRPASQVVRELMRAYVDRHRADYENQKIATARNSAKAGLGRLNEDVEADFASRRGAASA